MCTYVRSPYHYNYHSRIRVGIRVRVRVRAGFGLGLELGNNMCAFFLLGSSTLQLTLSEGYFKRVRVRFR
jgi:hypothetical protein